MVKGKPSRRESNENMGKIKKLAEKEIENSERYMLVYALNQKTKLFKKKYISYILAYNERTKDTIIIETDDEMKETVNKVIIEQDEIIQAKSNKNYSYKIKTPSREFEFCVPEHTIKDTGQILILQKENAERFKKNFEDDLITIKKVKLEQNKKIDK